MVSVQDGGRPGWSRYGIPASGPVDRLAHAVANTLVDRPADAAALEVSDGGLVVVADRAVTLAGASVAIEIDGVELGWSVGVVTVAAGARVSVRPDSGARWGYLAAAGGIAAPSWLGSAATHLVSGLGGGVLGAGDVLPVDGAVLRSELDGGVAEVELSVGGPVRVVLGPQDRHFGDEVVARLRSSPFEVTAQADRMGMRLDGPSLAPADALAIPSEPVVRGSIQVAGDGVPTVLLADHQPTGGYPKIATVISCDLDGLARRRPGAALRFDAVGPDEAVTAARAEAARRRRLLRALASPDRTIGQRLFRRNLIGGADPEV